MLPFVLVYHVTDVGTLFVFVALQFPTIYANVGLTT